MMAGVRILNVPYKGTSPAMTDVLGGQVDMMFISLVTGTAQVRAGNLQAYGVTTAKRLPSFPDVHRRCAGGYPPPSPVIFSQILVVLRNAVPRPRASAAKRIKLFKDCRA